MPEHLPNPPSAIIKGHIETIVPALFRWVRNVNYHRERWCLPDGDFLDIDQLRNRNDRAVIICHGLEGNSDRPYIKGMAKYLYKHGFDIYAMNFRGCSGESNRALRFYHSGATDDLSFVVDRVLQSNYKKIFLAGFSLGGNVILKYLGEDHLTKDPRLTKAIVFSVPMHLHSSCLQISKGFNKVYADRFLRRLKQKVRIKDKLMPGKLSLKKLDEATDLLSFDEYFTAPLHNFKNALDYYESCSSLYFLSGIKVYTLIVNALNDPFLTDKCYPVNKISPHKYLKMEILDCGGHCGFPSRHFQGIYRSEKRALSFFSEE